MADEKEFAEMLGNLLAAPGTSSDIAEDVVDDIDVEGLDIRLFVERYVETRDFHDAPDSIN